MSKNRSLQKIDVPLLLYVMVLVLFGLLMIFSSSVIMADIKWRSPYMFITKQAAWALIGMFGLLFFAHFDYHYFQKFAKPIAILAAVLLIAVLVFGYEKGGAKRWFRWGFVSFQPSELSKLGIIIFLADYLDRKKSRLKEWQGLWPPVIILGFFCFLIGMEPDLGTPVLILTISFCLFLVAGARLWHLVLMGFSVVPYVVFEVLRKPYRIERVKSFFRSWYDIHSGSYQLTQSILALGSGGIFGKGLAQGELKLMYLPEPHTDFIFPIIGEEIGYAGSLAVLLLFFLFAWRGTNIAKKAKDFFGTLLALGITWMIVFQVLINIGVVCGLLPTKGLPLPFLSFGGSSLLLNMISVGILLNISRSKRL